jgi:hypothetical protein
MGATAMRFGSVTEPMARGVKRCGTDRILVWEE